MAKYYRSIPADEKPQHQAVSLVGSHIEIYWDGDDAFYPGSVVGFNEETMRHQVVYENDEGRVTDEDLLSSEWNLWVGTDEEYELYMLTVRKLPKRSCAADVTYFNDGLGGASDGGVKRDKRAYTKLSYEQMVILAVEANEGKFGATLPSIRAYIRNNFEHQKGQQTASFNALTLKGLNKAIASQVIEKMPTNKVNYRISSHERERRKVAEREERKKELEKKRQKLTSGSISSSFLHINNTNSLVLQRFSKEIAI